MKALHPAKILLPKTDDYTSWACIACDQFTSEKEYWTELERQVKGKRTTLDLILPEIYLDEKTDERIARINENIRRYIKDDVFRELKDGFVLTVRSTPFVKRRIGLVAAIDLDEYEYSKKSDALIRSTEGTIEERIPPRLKIRKDAEVEFPHVMVLFDDEKREILEELYKNRSSYKKMYDFDLNMGGGHIEGYFIGETDSVIKKFDALLDDERLIKKYGKADRIQFAVGDGNHSLATAKAHWNNVKQTLTPEEKSLHPAKYALCEILNIYDEGIYFEPIYRLVFGVDKSAFLDGLKKIDAGNIEIYDGKETVSFSGIATLPEGIAATDAYIKGYIEKFGGAVDYIHGENNLKKLVSEKNGVGILFDKLKKEDLFKHVSSRGAFPRKTFSMGEGIEKRYYLEGRRIK